MKQDEHIFDRVNPEKIPKRELALLNALDVSIHRSLQKYQTICEFIKKDEPGYNRLVVVIAWELVDWIDRSRKILAFGAGLKKNDPSYQQVFRSLKGAEEVRNVLQHFNEYLNRSHSMDEALLGSITAWRYVSETEIEFVCFTAGISTSESSMGKCQMPTEMRDSIDAITLHIEGMELNLSDIVHKLPSYFDSIRKSVAVKYPLT